MSIGAFIRDIVLRKRLNDHGVLVVYDPESRYRALCVELESETTTVVDISDGTIEGREAAARALLSLPMASPDQRRQLLVYVPAPRPLTDDARTRDPFSVYVACGGVFPDSDGDNFQSLCLRENPDHATELRRLFAENASPSFELIDNIGGGVGYPILRTALGVDSARNAILALLAPKSGQLDGLKGSDAWLSEAKALFQATLGLELLTQSHSVATVTGELWRFVLFSEFVFDLPVELPEALGNVPRAEESARPLVEDLCDTLRSDVRTCPIYIERAEEIERDLGLAAKCGGIADLGHRDTFPFEERTFLASAAAALKDDRLDEIRDIVARRKHSVWLGKGESQEQWGLVSAALHLVEACDTALDDISQGVASMEALVQSYTSRLRDVDRLQREFEQAVGESFSENEATDTVIGIARSRYAKFAGKVQAVFIKHLDAVGWPPQKGGLANIDVFDRVVAPILAESGRRVAYILVDALRYELGVVLQRQLAETDEAEISPAFAQFPTITSVGMASLLPGAGGDLHLAKQNENFVVMLGDKPMTSVKQRMDILRARYGDRFAEMSLPDFVSKKKVSLPETVGLLVLRSTEIDSLLESNPESTLGLVHNTLKTLRMALHRLARDGFSDVVIVADHGFFLNGHAEAGDLCAKSSGNWILVHDRSLLGQGAGDVQNLALPAEKVGIKGDFETFVVPRSMAPYRRGVLFFHGGASLQEAIVPLIKVKLHAESAADDATPTVQLTYKSGAKRITTRLPVVDVMIVSGDMLATKADVEIQLEAHDKKGKVVGEAKAGGLVDVATGTLTLQPGQPQQVTIRMDEEFQGKFTLKALNPVTKAMYDAIELETDYAV